MTPLFAPRLYPVITEEFCAGRDPVDVLRAVIQGGARVVQLREKRMTSRRLFERARIFRKVTREHGVLLIVNDRADIALAAGADGVHLGQSDLPCEAARRLNARWIVGVSTHNENEAAEAVRRGASYVNLGPIFATRTKTAVPPVGVDSLSRFRPGLPFTVMGGIKKRHLPDLMNRGARHFAMVTEITQAPDIARRVRELLALIEKGNAS
jgi:thiamine-phosphate pyrophosphorylase